MKTIFLNAFIGMSLSFIAFSPLKGQESSSVVEEPMQTGIYEPTWESFAQYQCPEWFRNAKFGIWAHWGPQCEAEDGDWYARFMYFKGTSQYNYHVANYGNPATFGFKDLINTWKAEEWDPDSLVRFYKRVGARYFMALGNHHDNMDLWDSKYQEWNSVNVGPKKDIIGGWAASCKKYDMPLGISIHASHAWTWMEPSQDFDGKLTKADGVGKWWEGLDPQELYAQNHDRSVGSTSSGTIHSQWEWGAGASQPSEAYVRKFYNRTIDVINKYNPKLLYFDDTALPFYPINNAGLKITADFYNKSLLDNNNTMQAVVMGKKLTDLQKKGMLWDVERGIPDRLQEKPWQTCTCIGDWHYSRSIYNAGSYKSAATVVKMLIDIVSKNGNLLLNIPVRGRGTIDEKEVAVLNGIAAWMDINKESIYDTRPWTIFGEGPTADAANPLTAQGFNEGTNYTAQDIRFVQKDGYVYVTVMGWPTSTLLTVKSLSNLSPYCKGKINSVKLLGGTDLPYTCDSQALKVTLPTTHPNAIAFVLKVGFTTELSYADFQELIQNIQTNLAEAKLKAGNNTGQYDPAKIATLEGVIEEVNTLESTATAAEILENYLKLQTAFSTFSLNAKVTGGIANETNTQNVTAKYLKEARNFSRSDAGTTPNTRYGLLAAPWVVTPNIINQENNTRGGFDAWNTSSTDLTGRSISVQKWNATDAKIENGMIYQTTTLPAGSYNLRIKVHEQYGLKAGEIYLCVAKGSTLPETGKVKEEALTYYDMASSATGSTYTCCPFQLTEETNVCIGWAVSIAAAATSHSMRVNDIRLLKGTTDVSSSYLKNYTTIKRKDLSFTRFGIPTNWSIANFYITQTNSDGTKRGIDKYPGYNSLMMGIWDDASRAQGSLANAKIYRKVALPAGKYFFGASYNAIYQINKAYLFASYVLPTTAELEEKAFAFYNMKEGSTDGSRYGLTFTLPKDTSIYLGWAADFSGGSTEQEFRVKDIALLRYLEPNNGYLSSEAVTAVDTTFEVNSKEFSKVENAIPLITANNEAYLTSTDSMRIELGTFDFGDISTKEFQFYVNAADTAALSGTTGYNLYLDNLNTPFVFIPAFKTLSTSSFVASPIKFTLSGVHTLYLTVKGRTPNLWSAGFLKASSGVGIENVHANPEANWAVYTEGNTLYISGLEEENITVCDIAGHVIYTGVNKNGTVSIPSLKSQCTYLVKIGGNCIKIFL